MKLTKTCLFLSAMTAMLIGFAGSAYAQVSPLEVSATVIGACTITTTPVAFGSYNPLSAADNDVGQGNLQIVCTTGSSPSIGLNDGTDSPSAGVRRMAGPGSNHLPYSLFSDLGRTSPWGDTALTRVALGTMALSTPIDRAVYGRIPAQQNVAVGSYTDSVTATVNF
jgi:spore coat protein U-like protein